VQQLAETVIETYVDITKPMRFQKLLSVLG